MPDIDEMIFELDPSKFTRFKLPDGTSEVFVFSPTVLLERAVVEAAVGLALGLKVLSMCGDNRYDDLKESCPDFFAATDRLIAARKDT